MIKKEMFTRVIVFFFGIMIMCFGIALTIEASLGVSPWDVLHIGLYKSFGLRIGTWSQIIGLLIVSTTFFLDKSILSIGTVLNMIFVGWFIDLFLYITPTAHIWWIKALFLIIGIIFLALGSGMYIASKLGPGPRDGLMIVLTKRLNWSVKKVRTLIELIVLSVGWFLGGPVFIGTVIISLSIGPILQFFMGWWERKLEHILLGSEREKLV